MKHISTLIGVFMLLFSFSSIGFSQSKNKNGTVNQEIKAKASTTITHRTGNTVEKQHRLVVTPVEQNHATTVMASMAKAPLRGDFKEGNAPVFKKSAKSMKLKLKKKKTLLSK